WRMAIDDVSPSRTAVLAERPLPDGDLAYAAAVTLDARDAVTQDSAVLSAYVNILLDLSMTPSDPLYKDQSWNYLAVNLPAAWDYGPGSSEIRLAIIDSENASDQHPDLKD